MRGARMAGGGSRAASVVERSALIISNESKHAVYDQSRMQDLLGRGRKRRSHPAYHGIGLSRDRVVSDASGPGQGIQNYPVRQPWRRTKRDASWTLSYSAHG